MVLWVSFALCWERVSNICDVINLQPLFLSFQEMEYNSNSSSYVDQLFSSDEVKCQNAVMWVQTLNIIMKKSLVL